jgi:hypothetical protein
MILLSKDNPPQKHRKEKSWLLSEINLISNVKFDYRIAFNGKKPINVLLLRLSAMIQSSNSYSLIWQSNTPKQCHLLLSVLQVSSEIAFSRLLG